MTFTENLSPDNVEERNFLTFCMPSNIQLEDKGEFSAWCDRMIFIFEDLKWMLSLPVPLFWNQVLFDPSWLPSLDSFLQNAPRSYDLKNVPENCKTALSRVSKLFLLVIKRMSMNDEAEDHVIPTEVYGDMIYENFVFDAPKLLDICAIFERPDEAVQELLKEIAENVFHCQPSYYDDLSNAFDSIAVTITNMEERLLSSNNKGKPVNGREAVDMLMFLYDMTSSLVSFLAVFPKASFLLFRTQLISRLAFIYEVMVPDLMKLIEINQKKFKYVCACVQKNLNTVIGCAISQGFVARTKDYSKEENEEKITEYISVMDSLSQYKRLFARYCVTNDLSKDLNQLKKLEIIDVSNLEYLGNMAGIVVQETDADETLKQLRELMPHKSEEFIQQCISTYGSNVQVIFNNVMEGNVVDDTIKKPAKKKPLVPIPDKHILEDNKEHVARLKLELYNQAEEGDNYDNYDSVYDDEYDDTYDSQDVGAADTDSVDELTSRRKFTVPRVLQQLSRTNKKNDIDEYDDEEEEEDDDDENEGGGDGNGYGNGDGKEEGQQNKVGGDSNNAPKQFNNYFPNNNNRGKNHRAGGGGQNTSRGRGGSSRGRGGGRGSNRGNGRGGNNSNNSTNNNKGNDNDGAASNSDKNENANNNSTQRGGSVGGGRGRGGARGRGRGGKRNHRKLADKKMSKGMF